MKTINYAVISGSTRQNSQSKKVAKYISKTLFDHKQNEIVHLIDLSEEQFPLWDELIWSQGIDWHSTWSEISKKLSQSDAIIIVAPEWNGMAPPQLMNFFQLCSHKELSHKPGLIVSVSSGQGGTYPVAELRMNSFKNTKICYIPEHIIIRDVNNILNDVESVTENDQYIRSRIDHTLSLLKVYAEAFQTIREHDVVNNSKYIFGM